MRILHKFISLLIFVVLLGEGLVLLGAARSADRWDALTTLAEPSRLSAACAGIGLLCLAVLFALGGLPGKKRERFLSFDREGGTVSISTEAIADYVSKLADEFPSIIRMRPKVVPARNTIDIVVEVRIKAGPQIHEACELLQQRIRESVTSGLGISEVRRVEVSVREIISEHKPS